MSISQDELQKIAEKLSKIPGGNPKLLGNIRDVLSYMELLEGLDTTGVIPTVSVVESHAHLREDILANPTKVEATDLLACSKQKIIAQQIVLPNIMK